MDFSPLVSIVIPVFNGSNYMREAIDSALSQTYKNVEVIVVNDGSTDATEEIALSYGDRIRYIKKENGGVSSALNLGIKEMRGTYFSWLSHDDKYDQNKIELQVASVFKKNDDKLIAYCDSAQIDKNSRIIKHSKRVKHLRYGVNSWEQSLKALIKNKCLNGCSFLIPKNAFDQIGLFDETLRFAQDFKMWIKLLSCGYHIIYINECCVFNRIHKKQLTQTGNDLFHKDAFSIANDLLADLERVSTKKFNFVYYLCIYFAIYNCTDAVRLFKTSSFLSRKTMRICLCLTYGKVRPAIRNVYYKLFKKI